MRLRGDQLEWREADGEILALDHRRGRYFTVPGSGAVLWPLLAEGTTEEALVTRLTERYGITPSQARDDLAGFLSWLDDSGLLVR